MKTREKRLIVSLAFALALGLGTQAFALDDATTGGDQSPIVVDNSTDKTVVPIEVEDSFKDNSDNSNQGNATLTTTDSLNSQDIDKAKVGDNGNAANDDSTITTTDSSDKQKVEDKGNAANDGSTAVAVNDTLNGNTTDIASKNDNSNQDNSVGKTQVAVEVKDSLNDSSDNSNQDNTTDSYNDTAKAGDGGVSLVDSEDVAVTKDSLNGNIGEVEGGSVAATNGGTATMTDSFNTDASVNVTAKDGGIAVNGDNAVVTDGSYNNKAEDGSVAIYGDNSAEVDIASHNEINSDNTTTTVTVGNVGIEVATSVLDGEVATNTLTPGEGLVITTGNNTIDNGSVNATGITVLSQNSGIQSQVQQAVTVQYNGAIPQ